MCWFQKDPHKVDNTVSPGGKRARVWSRRAALTQASSQVRWGWSCARFKLCSCTHSHCAPAPLMLYQCVSASCIDQLLPTPRLSYLHYIHQGILLVGGGDSPGTAELVRYNQAMMIEYCKIHLWSKKLKRSTYSTLKALLIKRDQCQPWWYIVNFVAKNDGGHWPS